MDTSGKYPKLLSILESYTVNIMLHIDRLLFALKADIESFSMKESKIDEISLLKGICMQVIVSRQYCFSMVLNYITSQEELLMKSSS